MTEQTNQKYTVITFAPVQKFIEKSRKLRDLYGSSLLLSYLAFALCHTAKIHNCDVISPALINVTKGTPNQIIIKGDFPEEIAKKTFYDHWQTIVNICRQEIEDKVEFIYTWKSEWNDVGNHVWEFFWTQATIDDITEDEETVITHLRRKLNQIKYSRNWTGINWQGESSTLSGSEAIAWHRMGEHKYLPKGNKIKASQTEQNHQENLDLPSLTLAQQIDEITKFYEILSKVFSESIIDPDERLSIAEVIKRLVTCQDIAKKISKKTKLSFEIPSSFVEINRHENNLWTGWFQGDGDKIGEYLQHLRNQAKVTNPTRDINETEANILKKFSNAMMNWGECDLAQDQCLITTKNGQNNDIGRIVYAGGDDFFGVLYKPNSEDKLTAIKCLEWFYTFPELWQLHQQNITVSVGWVWTGAQVPQRDILQHCRETEKLAKDQGRDRLAIRILFNSGNYLDWYCPWWCLQEILEAYQDREGDTIQSLKIKPKKHKKVPNWTHFYNDVATVENRHGFANNREVALGLFDIYFPEKAQLLEDYSWDTSLNNQKKTGILGNQPKANPSQNIKALNQWIINLSKVGFHLFS